MSNETLRHETEDIRHDKWDMRYDMTHETLKHKTWKMRHWDMRYATRDNFPWVNFPPGLCITNARQIQSSQFIDTIYLL